MHVMLRENLSRYEEKRRERDAPRDEGKILLF